MTVGCRPVRSATVDKGPITTQLNSSLVNRIVGQDSQALGAECIGRLESYYAAGTGPAESRYSPDLAPLSGVGWVGPFQGLSAIGPREGGAGVRQYTLILNHHSSEL
jgi:hypothetical protein